MLKMILKGVVIGVANIIPGVSGGTMAVSMGIYDKIIHAATHFLSEFKKSMKILIPILIGAGLGLVVVARLIQMMFDKAPFQTNLLFVGLIVGGLPAMTKKVKGQSIRLSHIIACVLFFAFVVGLAAIGETEGAAADLSINAVNIMKLFGVGIIASATMVIPGVSGSMILMLIGYYNPVLNEVNRFIDNLVSFNVPGLLDGCAVLVPFGIGVVVGIVAIAKIIELIFKKFPYVAYWAIIGLIVASPFAIMMMNQFGKITVVTVLTGIVALVVGVVAAMKLGEE
ncbi:DUF368 domain-containing protein [Roseburia sp. 499]|uniref:DUF368 domain-containing protein n=1 Tax=Roseburia sp. 499 TaxID=1261634 RepID=UPI000950BF96|nr:DUF368 domain-containing protein [Roseburia sp. 499]WVK68926.1 DUF368 domain-containing protein [Roseburia sp. 499]